MAQARSASSFELVVRPGFDVGAHVHSRLEELFYVVEGELELLAFEPRVRTATAWRDWESAEGQRAVRGGRGTLMFVPVGCPHAFANRGASVARVFFYAAPPVMSATLRSWATSWPGAARPTARRSRSCGGDMTPSSSLR